ncbi:MAG: NAD(P) transhydrogenase subunit alpha [Rickettsiaceae bacterium]
MKIAAIKEQESNEKRSAVTPETAKLLIDEKYSLFLEQNIGANSGFSNQDYDNAGAKMSNVPLEIISDADIILKVRPSPLNNKMNELELAKNGAILIGNFSTYQDCSYLKRAIQKKLSVISMELVPRITKMQNIDSLSSQSNIAGYRAAIEAIYHYNKAIPMMVTAAGMIPPAKALIIGAGVAGLQAIATMKRMGAIVSAYDVRLDAKEQVESLGAKFLSPFLAEVVQENSDYTKQISGNNQQIQEEFLFKILQNQDIVITTAQIPGRDAPILINNKILACMKNSSVILDMAISSGGNVECSKLDEIVTMHDITVLGISNLPSRVPNDSTKLYANNIYNLLKYGISDNKFNFNDDIIKKMLLIDNGNIVNKELEAKIK